MSVHPGSSKMYNDLKKMYWWLTMKRDISEFVSRCLICQQVKAKHQVPSGLFQPMTIPEWKWERVTMDFVSGLHLSQRKKDAIWAIFYHLTKYAITFHFCILSSDRWSVKACDTDSRRYVSMLCFRIRMQMGEIFSVSRIHI
ncbi:integrase [Gossypium australe]|uniref:Integrase n=1 Tax=Gossypium australe TaxID=47621 RepID=A0A5B6VDV6_9ROSI|nr:integrase [Gossypium australe]